MKRYYKVPAVTTWSEEDGSMRGPLQVETGVTGGYSVLSDMGDFMIVMYEGDEEFHNALAGSDGVELYQSQEELTSEVPPEVIAGNDIYPVETVQQPLEERFDVLMEEPLPLEETIVEAERPDPDYS